MTDEPKTPAECVRELYELFSRGNIDATIELVDADFRMFEPGPEAILPWAGRFEGRDGFVEFNRKLADSVSAISIADLDFADIGNGSVLVTGVEDGTSATTGRSYRSSSLWIWEVRRRKIVSMVAYHDTYAMAAAFDELPGAARR